MLLIKIARPPGDFRHTAGEIDHVLAGAAAGLNHVAGFTGEELLQHRPDRLMVAGKRRRVETAGRRDRAAVLAEFHHTVRHAAFSGSYLAPTKGLGTEPQTCQA